jgi:hypothetical protein
MVISLQKIYWLWAFEVATNLWRYLLWAMMFKACQYATNDDKVFMGLTLMNEKNLN